MMRRSTGLFGAGMSCLLFSMVAYAGNKVPEAPFPVNFDPDIFDETSTTIDNEWWPLPPGKQMTWEGTALDDEGEKIPRKVVFTVTDMTKEIAGVRTVVGWDRDFQDGELTESELIFLAQSLKASGTLPTACARSSPVLQPNLRPSSQINCISSTWPV